MTRRGASTVAFFLSLDKKKMGSSSRALLLVAVAAAVAGLAAANFRDDCDIPWEPQNARFTSDGNGLSMSLVSNYSGTYGAESDPS